MLRHDCAIFHHEYDSFLEVPERAVLSFVKFAKPVVKKSQKQAAALGPNCCTITDHLDYIPPKTSPMSLPPFSVPLVAANQTHHNWNPTR
jgi:hypothetical protein